MAWRDAWGHNLGESARVEPERRMWGLKENGNGGNWKDGMDSGACEMRIGLTCIVGERMWRRKELQDS